MHYIESNINTCIKDTYKYDGVRSLKFIWALFAQLYTYWLRPCNSPLSPEFGLIFEDAIGQPR